MRRRLGLYLLVSMLLLLLGEVLYLAVGNWLLSSRLNAAAAAVQLELQTTGLRTLYPGDLRASELRLLAERGFATDGARSDFRLTARDLRARFDVAALLRGSLELPWLRAKSVEARVTPALDWLPLRSADGEAAPLRWRAGETTLRDVSDAGAEYFTSAVAVWEFASVGPLALNGIGTLRASSAREGQSEAVLKLSGTLAEPSTKLDAAGRAGRRLELQLSSRHRRAGTPARWACVNLDVSAALDGALGQGVSGDGLLPARIVDPRLRARLTFGDTSSDGGGEIELAAEQLALNGPVALLAPGGALLRALRVRLVPPRDHARVAGSISVTSPSVELLQSRLGRHFSLELHGAVAAHEDQLAFGPGEARLKRVVTEPLEAAALSMTLTVAKARYSASGALSLEGRFTSSGDDAGELFEWVRAEPAVRWMLAEVENRPFRLAFELLVEPDRVRLENVEISAAELQGSGAVRIENDVSRGAMLLQRGRLRAGVRVGAESAQLEVSPEEDWLRRALENGATAADREKLVR